MLSSEGSFEPQRLLLENGSLLLGPVEEANSLSSLWGAAWTSWPQNRLKVSERTAFDLSCLVWSSADLETLRKAFNSLKQLELLHAFPLLLLVVPYVQMVSNVYRGIDDLKAFLRGDAAEGYSDYS